MLIQRSIRLLMRRARRARARGLSTLCAAFAALAMLIAPAARAVPGPLDILSLPADVDLAICIRGAADASREPSGWAGRQMADELAQSLGLPDAWGELWKSLDLPPDQAIDQLLGRRVVVAMRWPDRGAPPPADARGGPIEPDWVVISLVTEDTERRIRRRLQPAPRNVESGQAILSLEDGRFYLTTRVLEDRGRGGERLALLMLAPSAHVALFKQMLPRLAGERGAGANLGDDPHLARLERLLQADVAMLSVGPAATPAEIAAVRDHEAAANAALGEHAGAPLDGGPHAGREITALGAWWRRGEALEAQGPGLNARIARLGPSVPRTLDAATGFAPGQIDALGHGALLALADMLPRAGDPGRPGGADAENGDARPQRNLTFGIPRSPGFAALVAAVVQMLDLPPDALAASVGPETIAVVHGEGTRASPLALTVGVAVRDLSIVAPSADGLMGAVLAAPAPEGPTTLGPNFRGAYPPAVRTAPIPAGSPAHLGGLLGETPSVSWHFAPAQGAAWWIEPEDAEPGAGSLDAGEAWRDAGPVALAAAPGKAGLEMQQPRERARSPWAIPGWWVARLAQQAEPGRTIDPAEPLRDVSSVLTAGRAERGVLTAGVARPALALAALAAVDVPIPVATRAIRWVDRVRWEGVLAEPGRLMIDVQIDLDPTKGATPP